MNEWNQPVFKRLALSELGEENSHTSGIVPTVSTHEYFGTPRFEGTHKIQYIVIEFWYNDKSKIITTNVNYHLTKTHNHPHLTGNILPAYKNEGAGVGDIVVFWRSKIDESNYKAELIKRGSARWREALGNGNNLDQAGGYINLTPPGIEEVQSISDESEGNYEIVSDIEDTFTIDSFPTVKRTGRIKQGERFITKRSKAKGDYVLKKQNYTCQVDPAHISFITPNDVQYMEKHHLISMKFYEEYENDLDDVSNIVGLCSNCHRQIHLGKKDDIGKMLETLYAKQSTQLAEAGLAIEIDELKKKYGIV